MAKARKPVSVFGSTSKEELESVSKKIMAKTAKPAVEPKHAPTPPKKRTVKKKVEEVKVKLKTLYIPEDKHQEAKINAARRGMKLNEYAAWLVSKDTKELG